MPDPSNTFFRLMLPSQIRTALCGSEGTYQLQRNKTKRWNSQVKDEPSLRRFIEIQGSHFSVPIEGAICHLGRDKRLYGTVPAQPPAILAALPSKSPLLDQWSMEAKAKCPYKGG
jgi:hypothetical protein